jgi:aryl-alcohol dehydrogenase-like predicted oxidoreductase
MAQALYARRALGASGLTVSPLGVGTNHWAAGKHDQAVFEAFQASLDDGINVFDTAELYSGGKSERLLGACPRRDGRPTIIASKYLPLPLHGFQQALNGSCTPLRGCYESGLEYRDSYGSRRDERHDHRPL